MAFSDDYMKTAYKMEAKYVEKGIDMYTKLIKLGTIWV